jgi:hypothetical protein
MPRKKRKPRQSRLKSFGSEKAAVEWANKQGFKDYSVKHLRMGLSNKFIVVKK